VKREDIDKAVDEQLYWHASQKPLPVGSVLHSIGSPSTITPSLVDEVRPPGTPKRAEHLFMVRDPDCFEELGQDLGENLIYRVKPTAPVRRADFRWIEEVYNIAADDPDYKENPKAIRAAKNYWSGKKHPRSACTDEYLTTAFKVEPR
jgi:hypothetical protein